MWTIILASQSSSGVDASSNCRVDSHLLVAYVSDGKKFLGRGKLALACWSAVGTRDVEAGGSYLASNNVDLSNWTTGVDHWSANSWLFESYECRSVRSGSVIFRCVEWRPSPTTSSRIIFWFLSRLPWISDILSENSEWELDKYKDWLKRQRKVCSLLKFILQFAIVCSMFAREM